MINFSIFNPVYEKVGEIRNMYFSIIVIIRYNGCVRELCTKADKYMITFPALATVNDKYLLISAALTIDYDLFESTCFS